MRENLRATLAGDGTPGPIEERIGRRLVRLVEPSSEEGESLLRSGQVELVGPEGEKLGRVRIDVAWRSLIRRLENQLPGSDAGQGDLVRDSITRLRSLAAAGKN